MASAVCSRCNYLLLPRPWLKSDVPVIEKPAGNRIAALYVRGEVLVEGRTICLPYWHKLVRVVDVES